MNKFVKGFLIFITSIFLLGIMGFYVFIISGWVRFTQDIWVTTAMTTMSHKWLATNFVKQEKIDEIMKRNTVDDSSYFSNPNLIDIKKEEPKKININNNLSIYEELEIDKYIREGYSLLENGLYKKDVSGTGWKGYLMLVSDPSRVSLAQTNKQFIEGQTVMSMVEESNSIAGINAGGFVDGPNYNSNGGVPAGLLIVDNKLINPKKPNNIKYNIIGFNNENVLILSKMTPQEALDNNIRDAVTFKPHLVIDGEKIIKEGTGGWGIAPRTALGQRKTGEVIFLVIDGRQPIHSIGVDIRVLQDVLYDEDCFNVAMVDGGSSSVMIYNNEFVNKPSLGRERRINNAWIIK